MIKLVDHKDGLKLTTPVIKGGSADLSNYYTKTETDEAIDNAVAAIPQPDLSEYAKKSELFSKDYNDLTNKPTIPSVEGLATTQYVDDKVGAIDVPSLDGYATEQWVEGKGYLTEHQSLADYAKKTDIPAQPDLTPYALKTEIPDVSGFALKTEIPSLANYSTTTEVQSMINTAIGSITDGNEVSY